MKVRVTTKNYEREVLKSELPVLVEFFADWCGKCAMLEDAVEEIAVEVVPTFVIFRNGKPVSAASGVLHKETVLEMLREEIGIYVGH